MKKPQEDYPHCEILEFDEPQPDIIETLNRNYDDPDFEAMKAIDSESITDPNLKVVVKYLQKCLKKGN